uniref:SNRNP25 ubiquitin-like domain-containing protein n=1 Tax=Strigamia maritima TaxID=126957 RepID=T1IHP2_STRMM
MSSMTFGQKNFTPKAPDKGSFPLDHAGECKKFMVKYMHCLQDKDNINTDCRTQAKDYLECRMEKQLMAKEDWKKLETGAKGRKQLSHEEAIDLFNKTLSGLMKSDPLLSDLPSSVTLDEVNSQIALEYGQAMTVNVIKTNGQVYPIVVEQKATVLDLKHAIKRHVTLKQSRDGDLTPISWKYIWRTFWLYFDGQKLMEDKKKLKEYGIHNRAEVTFIKQLKEK